MSFDYLLFDLDGTLTESGPGIMHSAAWALEQLGVDPGDEAKQRKFVGPPLNETFQEVYGLPLERIPDAIRLYRIWYNEHGGIYESQPYAGVRECLAKLKELGKHLLVATSKPLPMAMKVLEHWGLLEYFEGVFGGSMDESGGGCKKSFIVGQAMDCCGPDAAGKLLMIGDRKHDVVGAHANHIPCAGVLWGYGSREEFQAVGAEYIVESCDELIRCVTE